MNVFRRVMPPEPFGDVGRNRHARFSDFVPENELIVASEASRLTPDSNSLLAWTSRSRFPLPASRFPLPASPFPLPPSPYYCSSMPFPYEEFDLTGVRTYPLAARASK